MSKITGSIIQGDNLLRYNSREENTHIDVHSLAFLDALYFKGISAKYLQVEHFNEDAFFGESEFDVIEKATDIFIHDPDRLADKAEPSLNHFGFEMIRDINFHTSRLLFDRLNLIPRIGDLIYIPYRKKLYQIEYITDLENPLFGGSGFNINLSCKLYTKDEDTELSNDLIGGLDDVPELTELFSTNKDETINNMNVNDLLENDVKINPKRRR